MQALSFLLVFIRRDLLWVRVRGGKYPRSHKDTYWKYHTRLPYTTDLQTINLWTTPILAANFLKLDEGVTLILITWWITVVCLCGYNNNTTVFHGINENLNPPDTNCKHYISYKKKQFLTDFLKITYQSLLVQLLSVLRYWN